MVFDLHNFPSHAAPLGGASFSGVTMNSVTLSKPVTVSGQTYTTLTLREPKARDLLAGDAVQGETRKSYALMASLCDVELAVIEELALPDLQAVSEAFAAAMGNGQPPAGAGASQ